jgi:hypothetical protein
VRVLPNLEQLALAELRALEQRRGELLAPPADTAPAKPSRSPRRGHEPRSQPTLPVVEIRNEVPLHLRACPASGRADRDDGADGGLGADHDRQADVPR